MALAPRGSHGKGTQTWLHHTGPTQMLPHHAVPTDVSTPRRTHTDAAIPGSQQHGSQVSTSKEAQLWIHTVEYRIASGRRETVAHGVIQVNLKDTGPHDASHPHVDSGCSYTRNLQEPHTWPPMGWRLQARGQTGGYVGPADLEGKKMFQTWTVGDGGNTVSA